MSVYLDPAKEPGGCRERGRVYRTRGGVCRERGRACRARDGVRKAGGGIAGSCVERAEAQVGMQDFVQNESTFSNLSR